MVELHGHANFIRALASPGRGIEGDFAELECLEWTYLPLRTVSVLFRDASNL